MKASKFKAFMLAVCCFVIALCSEIRCTDNASDIQETTSYKAKNTNSEDCLDSLKAEIGSDSSRLLNQDKNKGPETSWASYIYDPVKSAIKGTYNIAEYAIKHPTLSLITSLLIAAQVTAVAADCNCIMNTPVSGSSWTYPTSLGMFPNASLCKSMESPSSCSGNGCTRMRGCY